MSLAIVELNDQNLLIQTERGLLHCEPGFAQLHSVGIETGERARATAWQQPQHSYNQYWRQLNQLPLPSKQKWARHHGDIAFAQLKQLVHDSQLVVLPNLQRGETLSPASHAHKDSKK